MSSNSSAQAAASQTEVDSSTATFISALVFNLVLGLVFYTAFSIVRTWNKKVYEGRTYLVEESKRSPVLSRGFWGWQQQLLSTSDSDIIKRVGLDAYMFLRFMRFAALIFTIFTVIGLPILMPINAVGEEPLLQGINVYTMGNVADARRLWVHLLLSVVFAMTIVYFTWKEMKTFIDLRQKYLISESHATSITATTILVTSIPADYNTAEKLREVFDKFPGGVERIFLNCNVGKLPDTIKDRQSLVEKLEGAETAYIKAGVKHYLSSKGKENGEKDAEKGTPLPEKIRPQHRTGVLGLVGKKVDSMTIYREEITKLNQMIESQQKQDKLEDYPRLSSAFIRFRTQIAAQMAAQSVIHSHPFAMTPRYMEIQHDDIIWDNLNMGTIERLIRTTISNIIVAAIVLLWAIPTAFVASIASISALAKVVPFLKVLEKLPPSIFGIIQGVLPPVFLAVLMALVPIVFRLLTKLEGVPSGTSVTFGLLDKYYFFLMVNVLFVTTLSKGIFETLPALAQNPTSAISLLATNVPTASTFFITYILLNALNASGLTMLQIGPLVVTYIFDKFLAKTPRGYFNLWSSLGAPDLGQLVPQQTLVFAIGLVYSVIAPIILPFTMLYFFMFYFVFMYQFLYSFNTRVETGGLAFPKAIRHVYIALFIFELLMIGILLGKSAIPQAVIMIVMVIVTAFVLFIMDYSFTNLLKYVPVTLADTKLAEDAAFHDLSEKSRFGLLGSGAEMVSGLVSKTTETVGAGVSKVGSTVKKITSPVTDATIGKIAKVFHSDDEVHASEEELQRHRESVKHQNDLAYLHPALRTEEPTVWIPHDEYGISVDLSKELEADKIKHSSIGATIVNKKIGGPKVVVAKEVFEAAVGVPNGMAAPVAGGSNSAQAGLSGGIYADNAMGLVAGEAGMLA